MITGREIRAALNATFAESGFVRQRRTWSRRSKELVWLVQLDRSPYKEGYGLEIGVYILRHVTGTEPTTANDCPIIVYLENLPLATPVEIEGTRLGDFRSAAIAVLDLTRDMGDEDRKRLLTTILVEVSEYIAMVDSEEMLRVRYEAGDFRSAFIRKDVKRILSGADGSS